MIGTSEFPSHANKLVFISMLCGDSLGVPLMSIFIYGIMELLTGSVRNIFGSRKRNGSQIIKDGSQIRFWEDGWLGHRPLRDQYPSLYNIARRKQDTVAQVLATNPPDIPWRRDLIGNKLVMWNNFLPRIANIVLNHNEDEFR